MSDSQKTGRMSSASSASSSSSTENDRLFEKWRKNISWITGLGLSKEEKLIREKERQERIQPLLIKKCNQVKDSLMTSSPTIVFMLKHLRSSGCPVEPGHIRCVSCRTATAGGFSPDLGGILICTQGFSNKTHMENTIVHELLHMYDHCKFKVDWRDLRHHACSEIRAASLSGDCHWIREMNRMVFGFSKQPQACVRRRAALSVAENPNCPDRETAEQAVNEVWESCFNDTRPFDEIH